MVPDNYIYGAICADNEQACSVLAACQVRHEIERGIIAPVQILEHEQQWRLQRDRFDRLSHFAQHSLAGRSLCLRLQDGSLSRLDNGRHLAEPAGSMLSQTVQHLSCSA